MELVNRFFFIINLTARNILYITNYFVRVFYCNVIILLSIQKIT